MITDPLQLGAIRAALRPLDLDPSFSHKMPVLARFLDKDILAQIKADEEDARAINKSAVESGLMLSPEAALYWEEVQAQIKRGKRLQAEGTNPKLEKDISLACEALAESFEARVPVGEQPKFKHLTWENHEQEWDERWSYVEHEPPLLRDEFSVAFTIPNVKNHAQRNVLSSLVGHQAKHEELAAFREARLELRRLTRAEDGIAEQERLKVEQRAARKAHLSSLSKTEREAFKVREKQSVADAVGNPTSLLAVKSDDIIWPGETGSESPAKGL